MKKLFLPITAALTLAAIGFARDQRQQAVGPNPAIDMQAHIKLAQEAAEYREQRRLTEDDFITMSYEQGTIILDTRSREKYDELHVKGAVHLNFSDITTDSLAKVIPEKTTRVLIYCNNNFKDAGPAFAPKRAALALNLPTFITLYGYGYRNIYELGPQLDPKQSKLQFESNTKSK